jgi:hypothetical protein
MASHLRLLVGRDVTVIRDGQPEHTRLRVWLDSHDGQVPGYRIELAARAGDYTCPYPATAPDMFEALVRLRRQLEPDRSTAAVPEPGTIPTPAAWRTIWAAG